MLSRFSDRGINDVVKVSSAAKTRFRWRYVSRILQDLPLADLAANLVNQGNLRRWSGPGGWLVVATGLSVLLYWNGRLVVATGAGLGVMTLIYLMHDWDLTQPLTEFKKLLHGWNQPLVLAALGGGMATLTTYLAASLWLESSSPTVALAAILQGAGTVTVLILLVWHLLHQQSHRTQTYINQMLTDLAHADPLKRLIAVRQLTDALPEVHRDPVQRRAIAEYFRLMATREPDPFVRDAVLDGLKKFEPTPAGSPSFSLAAGSQPRLPELQSKPLSRPTIALRKRLPIES